MDAVSSHRLVTELRRLRRALELTQDRVASDMDWSLSKIIRVERGTVKISVSDLRSLLAYYGVGDRRTVDGLLDLARAAKRRQWWDEFRGVVSPQMLTYVGYEAEATAITSFVPISFPDLMATRRYAGAVLAGQADVERQVEFCMRRQEQVSAAAPQLVFVLDESVLYRRPDGDDKTLLEQLEHAVEFAQRPNVSVHVFPYTAGGHPGWNGDYTVIEVDGGQVLAASLAMVDDPAEVGAYAGQLADLVSRSLDRDESLEALGRVADEIRGR